MALSTPVKISIILPCYNEEQNVLRIESELLPVLRSFNVGYEVICIDDGSKDNTYNELEKLSSSVKQIRIIKHELNKGLGAAVRAGIESATGELTITLDADFTFHPRQIPNLLQRFKQEDVDFVIGSPYLAGYEKDIPFYRKFLSWMVNLLYTIVLLRKITAVSPIFRLYKTQDLKEIISSIKTTGFDINAEILFRLLQNKKRFAEIPASLTTRIYGESKLNNFKEIKNHLKLLFKIMFWRLA